jgi:hypothetical protein
MHKQLYFCVVLLIVAAAGCNLPKYPIDDPPVVKIDNRLLGKWAEKKRKDKDIFNDIFIVTRKNDYQYLITVKEKNKKPEEHIAFLSRVKNAIFLNVYNKEDSGSSYLLLRLLDVNGATHKITAAAVSDSTMQYLKGSPEVREYVTKHMDDPSFYNDTGYFCQIK